MPLGHRAIFTGEQWEVKTRHIVYMSKQEEHISKQEGGIGEVGIVPLTMVLLANGLPEISRMVKKRLFNCAKVVWVMCRGEL